MKNYGIVFGAAGLLGPIWAESLAEKADKVFLVGLNLESDKSLQKLVKKYPGTFELVSQDLNSAKQLNSCKVISQYQYRYAIFSAGTDSVPNSHQENRELYQFPWETWERYVTDNIRIFVNCLDFFCARRTNPAFGVAIGSMYASISPNPNNYKHTSEMPEFLKHPGYSASKSAIKAIVRQYGSHYASQGLILNILSPGVVENNQPFWFKENVLPQIPTNRFIDPIELIGCVNFLTSKSSNHLIGHELIFDGGYNLW